MLLKDGTDWRMDSEKKAKWVAALRSEEYEQGDTYLCFIVSEYVGDDKYKDKVKYCCLGVYGDLNGLLRKGFVRKSEFNFPKRVAKGRSRDFAEVGDGPADNIRMSYLPPTVASLPYEVQLKLAELNDSGDTTTSCRWTFAQIATWIEENL